MNLRTVTNKRGSYIVEASISLPVFIIAILVLSSVILMYSCIEDTNYIMATELRRVAAEAVVSDADSVLVYSKISDRVKYHSQVAEVWPKAFRYRDRYGEIDNVILLSVGIRMESDNILGLMSDVEYTASLVTRAYVGRIRTIGNMSEDEMKNDGDPVFIFPSRGERYHRENCTFLKAASKSGILDDAVRDKYSPCPTCHSKNAANGSLIYYFPNDGESYHIGGCATLSRNFIETDRETATERGYTACAKCGG